LLFGIGILILLWSISLIFGADLRKTYYFNITNSVPIGIYKAVKTSNIEVGEYVIFDLPDSIAGGIEGRPWFDRKIPLLKKVGALEEAQFEVVNNNFFIDGKYIGPVFSTDTAGLSLPQNPGAHIVRQDYFLPVANAIPNSFDGRYYGDIPISKIRAVVKPLLVKGKLF
jgi:conjugative transfer signal peptidase TraF